MEFFYDRNWLDTSAGGPKGINCQVVSVSPLHELIDIFIIEIYNSLIM